jgi:hypothetical protein
MSHRPYDNKQYRYRHSDTDRREGLAKVASLLGLGAVSDENGLFYDLSFYSGGIGVDDHLAVTVPATAGVWMAVLDARPVKTPEEIAADPALAEDFLWLVRGDDTSSESRASAVAFINSEKREFQAECRASDKVLFSPESNVNDWFVLWGTEDVLHCLAFSQG